MSPEIVRKPVEIVRGASGIERKPLAIQRGKLALDLRELLEAEGVNPLDELGAAEGLEAEQGQQMSAVVSSVRAVRAAYAEQLKTMDDPRFYCVVVFQSEAQKLEFLQKAGWEKTTEFKDKSFDNMFLNGLELARRLGVEITEKVDLPQGYKLRGKPDRYRKEVIIP